MQALWRTGWQLEVGYWTFGFLVLRFCFPEPRILLLVVGYSKVAKVGEEKVKSFI
jgi:hypothetical protein